MSFVYTQPIGSFSNIISLIGPALSGGGNFSIAEGLSPGTTALVGISIEGVTTVSAAGLTVTDTQGNTYTLLGQVAFGSNLLAVFGSVLAVGLTQQDYIGWTTSADYYQSGIGIGASNCTVTVDNVATGSNSGTAPNSLGSGTSNATYGDVVFGFTGFVSALAGNPTPTGPAGWDSPTINSAQSYNDQAVTQVGAFASETFATHGTAVTYNPGYNLSSTFGTIVLSLRPLSVTGTMNLTERPDFARWIGVTHADPIPPTFGPFYFAYVDNDSVPFDEQTHSVWDENILDMEIQHDEGQVPVLSLTIKNPRVGLLAPSRKQWAYLSVQTETSIVPIFFGVLVGIPSDFFAEVIVLKFHARPSNYIEAKQAVAEPLRVAPYYDPVFIDQSHRDDPDAILEGYSALYHVDRVTLDVSTSDILEGEDGTITFDESTHPLYDSVKMSIGECPLQTVQVQASVKWTQRCIGYVAGPPANISSYTGGSFKSDWPKAGANIGGGWRVESSYVWDVDDTEHAYSLTQSWNWKNSDPTADDCSVATMSYQATLSPWKAISVEGTGARQTQTGVCDPYAYTAQDLATNSGPSGLNIPAKVSTSGTSALLWTLNCAWTLRYDSRRDFDELVVMNITANLQSTLTSPTVDQNTELIKVTGADVGQPLETPNAWSDYAGQTVPIATLIFPNDPTLPGGTAYQMCIGEGVAGNSEPTFSDVPGVITLDGSVEWASLGDAPPSTEQQWTDSTAVGQGTIVVVEPKVFSAATGDMQTTGASYFFLCIQGGTTNAAYTEFEYLPTVQQSDQAPPKPVPFSVVLGPGDSAHSDVTGGGDGPSVGGVGSRVYDGSVTWVNLGTSPPTLPIPIGGTMTNVTARNYFSTDRGNQSLEYLICKARARIRNRARCVKVEFDVPFMQAIGLSCRMNGTLYDARLPGGAATGKVISYTLTADKDGKFIAHVVLGVAVGYGGSVTAITGNPDYVQTGYVNDGYQEYSGAQYTTAEEDIAYTPPGFQPFDDGLSFPLSYFPGTLTITRPIQDAQIFAAFAQLNTPELANLPSVTTATRTPGTPASELVILKNQSAVDWLFGGFGTYILECDPVAAEVLLHPVTNGPFSGAYYVQCTPLEIPQGINLEAESSP